jgi:DNA helicase HerA-like ATPase
VTDTGRPTVPIGLIDGSAPSTSRRFSVVLNDDAVVQLDDLVGSRQQLPDGTDLAHYGIVVEGYGQIEGADLPSDTRRITAEKTMPGATSRRVDVQILRTVPEMWLPPDPGAVGTRVRGEERSVALFVDQMDHPLALGLDTDRQPIYADFSFINGEKGGHISISGISGVATKTSYALFALYMLFETPEGRALLGAHAPNTKALVFNVKGEDLLHLDRPNAKFATTTGALEGWRALGVEEPGPFRSVRFYAPRSAGSRDGSNATDVVSRSAADVRPFGWTPERFINGGLLRYCFAEEEDARTQISFVEQRVRVQLVRHAHPLEGEPGAVVLAPPPAGTPFDLAKLLRSRRDPIKATAGDPIRDFGDLADFLTDRLSPPNVDSDWSAGVADGTCLAFLRRLYGASPRLGHLVQRDVEAVALDESVTVVDIHSLHDTAQRFVVGALTSAIFEDKQGKGREPLRFIVLDELNKYAPREGRSPIKDVLVDIAARGRSLGVILIGAQQSATEVEPAIIRNASVKVVGRLDAGESADYRFLTPEVRERATRFLPGTMVLDQPMVPAPIPIRFPFPAFATSVGEDLQGTAASGENVDRLFEQL